MLDAFQADVLGAFAADFEDRAHLRIERAHHAGDGFELVLEEQAQDLGDAAAARTRDADALDAVLRDGLVELPQQVVGGLYGAAGDAPVLGEHQRPAREFGEAELRLRGAKRLENGPVAGLAEGGQFETDRADVQTDIDTHFRPV